MDNAQNKQVFFTGIKHIVQYDTWEQFTLNEIGLRRIWNDFTLFSWNNHPTQTNLLQLSWISNEQYNGDLPTSSPIKRLNSYLEVRLVEIKYSLEDQIKIQSWLLLNTPSFWKNPSSFSAS